VYLEILDYSNFYRLCWELYKYILSTKISTDGCYRNARA